MVVLEVPVVMMVTAELVEQVIPLHQAGVLEVRLAQLAVELTEQQEATAP
jgi:hypothetical protein